MATGWCLLSWFFHSIFPLSRNISGSLSLQDQGTLSPQLSCRYWWVSCYSSGRRSLPRSAWSWSTQPSSWSNSLCHQTCGWVGVHHYNLLLMKTLVEKMKDDLSSLLTILHSSQHLLEFHQRSAFSSSVFADLESSHNNWGWAVQSKHSIQKYTATFSQYRSTFWNKSSSLYMVHSKTRLLINSKPFLISVKI